MERKFQICLFIWVQVQSVFGESYISRQQIQRTVENVAKYMKYYLDNITGKVNYMIYIHKWHMPIIMMNQSRISRFENIYGERNPCRSSN